MKNDSFILFQNFEMQMKRLSSLSSFLAVKAEFEAEGTRIDELAILSELCCKNSIPLTLKIGGPTAQRDIYEAFQLGASNILVPMVESKYSLLNCFEMFEKFLPLFKDLTNTPKLFINIESQLALKNINSILKLIEDENLPVETIVIGRSDLSKSLMISDVDNEKMLKICIELLSKKNNLNVTIGGNLMSKSFAFIRNLSKKGLYAFESRKCTFKTKVLLKKNDFNSLIDSALQFELAWLNCKKNLYGDRSQEENLRIKTIESRLKNPNL